MPGETTHHLEPKTLDAPDHERVRGSAGCLGVGGAGGGGRSTRADHGGWRGTEHGEG